MRDYSLSHLSDAVLLRDLAELVGQERVTIAALLAHIAEVDTRKLYAPAGHPSMFAYCVDELHLSEDAAYKRIQAARAARRFPALFTALADGRLHLTAVCLLAPHLTPESVEELVEGATRRRKTEIEDLIASRFQLPPVPRRAAAMQAELAPEQVEALPCWSELAPEQVGDASSEQVSPLALQLAPGQVEKSSNLNPRPVERLVQLTVRKSIQDKLRHAQALLSHAIPGNDASEVLERALDLLIAHAEKRKLGSGTRSPVRRRTGARTRHVPSHLRRAVWERDQGRCTFVGTNGHRCNARKLLEFDHVQPYARGGDTTAEGMRLRCRAHNQLEAERVFGAGFMERKREEARRTAEEKARGAAEGAPSRAAPDARVREQVRDVLAGLRGLGLRGETARRAADFAATLEDASLAERMRAALQFHRDGLIQGRKASIVSHAPC